jgi:hypothetical protein
MRCQPGGGAGDEHRASLKGVMMVKFRSLLVVLGLAAMLLIPAADAYARGGRGGGGGGRGGGGGGAPPPPPDPFAAQNKDVADATTAMKDAEAAYNKGALAFEADYKKTPDYAAAQKTMDDATAEVDAARTAAINKLKTGSVEYKAAVLKVTDARKKLDTIRANGGTREQISAQSKAIQDASDAVTKLETDAVTKDTRSQDAKKKLAEATDGLKVQKDKMTDAKKEDEKLKELQTAVDAAKTKVDDAKKALADAKAAKSGG